MTPQFLPKMTAAQYHADPCPTPSLSSSIAKVIVGDSPLHAWMKHPRLGGIRDVPTAEQERGTILHAMLLGDGKGAFVPIEAENYRTKAAQEERDAIRESGRVPLLMREADDLAAVANDAEALLLEQDIVLDGDSESVVVWQEESPYGKVLCRGMIDHLIRDRGGVGLCVYDLKFCDSANPRAIRRKIVDMGYDIQRAAYLRALEQIQPDLAGRIKFYWLFIETLPLGAPRRVALTVAEADGSLRELGERRWASAVETWDRCLRSNQWPAYATGIVSIEAPPWALMEVV